MTWNSGHADSYQQWVGKYANLECDYFARHSTGNPIRYTFNNEGFRGPKFHKEPDISIFGSSFSFGVGIEWDQCWHQQLRDYKVNCYAPAGFAVRNSDILEYYNIIQPAGITILQFREIQYDIKSWEPPGSTFNFIIEKHHHPTLRTLTYDTFIDKANDGVHPGKKTHQQWAKWIIQQFNL